MPPGVFKTMAKVFLATPSYMGNLRVEFVAALMAINGDSCPGHTFQIQFVNGDGVARARNNIAAMFLAGGFDELLFIDGDIQFSASQVARLLSHDVDVVGGFYPIKQRELRWCATALDGGAVDEKTGLQNVLEIGTGFLRIRRKVIERMVREFPEIEYVEDMSGQQKPQWDFFSMGVVHDPEFGVPVRRYLSEDYYFQYRCRKMGFGIFADTFIQLGHVGSITYPIQKSA